MLRYFVIYAIYFSSTQDIGGPCLMPLIVSEKMCCRIQVFQDYFNSVDDLAIDFCKHIFMTEFDFEWWKYSINISTYKYVINGESLTTKLTHELFS